jgi:CRP-like cAMP-binding protein
MMASLPLSSLLLDPQLPIRGLKPGAKLLEQGAAGRKVVLLLEGVMAVERDGEVVSESNLARSWARRRRWSTTWWSWALSPGRVHDRGEACRHAGHHPGD